MALYRKYRPATFAEVIGQQHVTVPLSAALESRDSEGRPDRINHAYLFSGPRGCGKTSSARIMARSLNCEHGPTATPCGKCASCRALAPGGPGNLDVIELDAASHNGVEDMRELREQAVFQPAESRYRIFVIDEAHMITPQGFNALLKIVEEPPEHLIFIFATTEPEKVLPTIRSRTHHYPFRLLTPPDMRGLLERVVESEGVKVDPDVYPLVIQAGGGSPRDALSVMDQLIAGSGPNGVEYETSAAILGVTDANLLTDACSALAEGNRAELFDVVNRVIMSGQDPAQFALDLQKRVRDLLVLGAVPDAVEQGLVEIPESQADDVKAQSGMIPPATLTRYAKVLNEGARHFRGVTSPRLLLEVLCARMLLPATDDSIEGLLQRVEALERGITAAPGSDGSAGAALGAESGTSSRSSAERGDGAGAVAKTDASANTGVGETAATSDAGSALSAREQWRLRRQQQKAAKGVSQHTPQATGDQETPDQQHVPHHTQSVPQPMPQRTQPAQHDVREEQYEAQPQAQESQTQQQEPPASQEVSVEHELPAEQQLSPEEVQARRIQEAREAARRAQEVARQQERAERERLALEREAAIRQRDGEAPVTAQVEPAKESGSVQEQRAKESVSAPAQPVEQAPAENTEVTQHTETQPAEPEPAEASADTTEPARSGSSINEGGEPKIGVETVVEKWQEILEATQGEHAHAVKILAAQATPLEFDDGTLTIGHATGALATRLNDARYAQTLSSAASQVLGVDIRVTCVVGMRPRERRSQSATSDGGSAQDEKSWSGSSPAQDDADRPVDASQGENNRSSSLDRNVPEQRSHSGLPPRISEQRAKMEALKQARAQANARRSGAATPNEGSTDGGQSLAQGNGNNGYTPSAARQRGEQVLEQNRGNAPVRPQQNAPQDNVPHQRTPQASAYDDVPPPPEPMDDYEAPPEEYGEFGNANGAPTSAAAHDTAAARGANPATRAHQVPRDTPPTSSAATNPVAATRNAAGMGQGASISEKSQAEEEEELLASVDDPGSLDHRSMQEVVMDLLANELGARPL